MGSAGSARRRLTLTPHGRIPLVERDRELRLLSRAAADAESGARLVLVTGEAGAGKSRLVAEFAATLPESWRTVRTGAPYTERTVGAPFEGLVGTVPDAGDPASALARALADAVRARAEGSPLLLTIEDLHWLDPTGLWAIGQLLDLLTSDPVLVLATFRLGSHRLGSGHSRAVAGLVRHPRSDEFRLAPLSLDAISALSGQTDPSVVAALHRRSGGNPFFVEALVQAGAEVDVHWTVAEIVLEQLAMLDDGDRALVELLAVAAAPLAPVVVHRVLEDRGEVGTAHLIDRGTVVVLDDGAVALRHGIVGEAVRHRLLPSERQDLHRRLAEALEGQGDPDVEAAALAAHWSGAGEPLRAARWAAAAADRLLTRRSYVTALSLYRAAVPYPPPDAKARAGLLEPAALAAAMAGDAETAREWAGSGRRRPAFRSRPRHGDGRLDEPRHGGRRRRSPGRRRGPLA